MLVKILFQHEVGQNSNSAPFRLTVSVNYNPDEHVVVFCLNTDSFVTVVPIRKSKCPKSVLYQAVRYQAVTAYRLTTVTIAKNDFAFMSP